MNLSFADQLVWDFEDNRGDIAIVEEVLAMAQEGIAVIPVFVVEGILKIMKCDNVDGEHIGSDSDEGANTRLAMDSSTAEERRYDSRPPVSCEYSGSRADRIAQAHKRNALA